MYGLALTPDLTVGDEWTLFGFWLFCCHFSWTIKTDKCLVDVKSPLSPSFWLHRFIHCTLFLSPDFLWRTGPFGPLCPVDLRGKRAGGRGWTWKQHSLFFCSSASSCKYEKAISKLCQRTAANQNGCRYNTGMTCMASGKIDVLQDTPQSCHSFVLFCDSVRLEGEASGAK